MNVPPRRARRAVGRVVSNSISTSYRIGVNLNPLENMQIGPPPPGAASAIRMKYVPDGVPTGPQITIREERAPMNQIGLPRLG